MFYFHGELRSCLQAHKGGGLKEIRVTTQESNRRGIVGTHKDLVVRYSMLGSCEYWIAIYPVGNRKNLRFDPGIEIGEEPRVLLKLSFEPTMEFQEAEFLSSHLGNALQNDALVIKDLDIQVRKFKEENERLGELLVVQELLKEVEERKEVRLRLQAMERKEGDYKRFREEVRELENTLNERKEEVNPNEIWMNVRTEDDISLVQGRIENIKREGDEFHEKAARKKVEYDRTRFEIRVQTQEMENLSQLVERVEREGKEKKEYLAELQGKVGEMETTLLQGKNKHVQLQKRRTTLVDALEETKTLEKQRVELERKTLEEQDMLEREINLLQQEELHLEKV